MVSGATICIKAAHSSDPGASDVGDPSWSICHPWLRETTTGIHTHNPAPKQTHTHILLNARATPTHFIDIQDIFSHRCRYSGNSFFQTPPTPSPTSHTHTLTQYRTHKRMYTEIPETLTPSCGAGGWGIATTHFASMQPPSKLSGHV